MISTKFGILGIQEGVPQVALCFQTYVSEGAAT
jgi:hypothetical protein